MFLPEAAGDEIAQNRDTSDRARIWMRQQEIATPKADIRKNADKAVDGERREIMEDADAGAKSYGFDLSHDAGAPEYPAGLLLQNGRIIQSRSIGEIVNARNNGVVAQSFHGVWLAVALQIAFGRVDAQRVVNQARDKQASLDRSVENDCEIRLSPRERECSGQRDEFDDQIGIAAGQLAQLSGEEVIAQSIGGADPHGAGDISFFVRDGFGNAQKFELDPLCDGEKALAGLGHDAARRPAVEQARAQ